MSNYLSLKWRDKIRLPLAALLPLIQQRSPRELIGKAYLLWKRAGFRGIWCRLTAFTFSSTNYSSWVKRHDTLTENDRQAITSHITSLQQHPHISLLMPTDNATEWRLRQTIESVRNQRYPHWELCIANNTLSDKRIQSLLDEYQQLDTRVKIIRCPHHNLISAASNHALQQATGEFAAFIDHGDTLAEKALYMVALAINTHPKLDLIYSDEDTVDEKNKRHDPDFKPDCNPDLLTTKNVICHLSVYRTTLIRKLGGFRSEYEGAHSWDLALRVIEIIPSSHIKHISSVLYHRRSTPGSDVLKSNESNYATIAGEKVLNAHLARTHKSASVLTVSGKHFRIRYEIPTPTPLVSIIIPTRDGINLLQRCVDSIFTKTSYSNFEVIIVDNQSTDSATLAYLKQLAQEKRARILKFDAKFNYSTINNNAVNQANGTFICLMNNDIEVISEEWLDEMVSQASRPEIGAVGAMLYYPDETIQHAGVLLGLDGIAGHLYSGQARGIPGYMNRAELVQNLSAVTGACLVIRKNIYQEVGGLDETNLPVAFNDVDFCIRVQDKGYRNLWTPFAEFYHHESATRGYEDTPEKQRRSRLEIAYMQARWGARLEHDPAYNQNLTLSKEWPYLSLTSRIDKPWRHESF